MQCSGSKENMNIMGTYSLSKINVKVIMLYDWVYKQKHEKLHGQLYTAYHGRYKYNL